MEPKRNDFEVVTGDVVDTVPTRSVNVPVLTKIVNGAIQPIDKLTNRIVNGILEAKQIESDEAIEKLTIETDAKIKMTLMEYTHKLYEKLSKLDERRLTMIEDIIKDSTMTFDQKKYLIDTLAPKTVYNFELT